MSIEQISIFIENKSGRLAEVTALLAEKSINIRALSLADTVDFGIFRLIVDDPAAAEQVLKAQGFTVAKNDVVAVVVPDRPGGLAGILGILRNNAVNVEYMYAFVQRSEGNAVLIFRFDEPERAVQLLATGGFRMLTDGEMRTL